MGLLSEAVGLAWSAVTHWPLFGAGLATVLLALPLVARGEPPR